LLQTEQTNKQTRRALWPLWISL